VDMANDVTPRRGTAAPPAGSPRRMATLADTKRRFFPSSRRILLYTRPADALLHGTSLFRRAGDRHRGTRTTRCVNGAVVVGNGGGGKHLAGLASGARGQA